MNEKIKELADKVWADEYWENNIDRLLPAQLERFAELIVKECAGECMWNSEALRIYNKFGLIDEHIKQHFGVE